MLASLESKNDVDSIKHRARLLACADSRSSDFLKAVPNFIFGTRLSQQEFSVAFRLRLGMEVLDSESICQGCNRGLTSDKFGHHALSCVAGGHIIARHNAIRDCIYQTAMAAGLNPKIEAPNLLDHSAKKPADVFIPNWSLGKGISIDVRVTSPLQKSIIHAAREAGKAAQFGFDDKMKKYREENKDYSLFHFCPSQC